MKQIFNFLLIFIMVASVLSCKKSEPKPELTPAQKIVGKYIMTVSTSTINGVVKDDLAGRPACAADDITEFTVDGNFIENGGIIACVPAPTPSNQIIAYSLAPDAKTLTLTFTFTNSPVVAQGIFSVNELTNSTLKISIISPEIDGNGAAISRKVDTTYTKI